MVGSLLWLAGANAGTLDDLVSEMTPGKCGATRVLYFAHGPQPAWFPVETVQARLMAGLGDRASLLAPAEDVLDSDGSAARRAAIAERLADCVLAVTVTAPTDAVGAGVPTVTARIDNIDDRASMRLNGVEVLKGQYGTQGVFGSAQPRKGPGDTGTVDVSAQAVVGANEVQLYLWNAKGCCDTSATFEVHVAGERVGFETVARRDSNEGIKLDKTVSFQVAPVSTATQVDLSWTLWRLAEPDAAPVMGVRTITREELGPQRVAGPGMARLSVSVEKRKPWYFFAAKGRNFKPAQAAIKVDGTRVGRGSWTGEVPAGHHVVRSVGLFDPPFEITMADGEAGTATVRHRPGIVEWAGRVVLSVLVLPLALIASGSDEDLKHPIVHVGETPDGIAIYDFRYKPGNGHDPDVWYRGVVAQQVHEVRPAAVLRNPKGTLEVIYPLTGVRFERLGTALPPELAAMCAAGATLPEGVCP